MNAGDLQESGSGRATAEVYIGAQGFSPKDWVGTFYPPGLPASQFLPFYARVLNTVELNTTFYAIPSLSTVRAWALRVPSDFVFTAKMVRAITHDKGLLNVEAEVRAFIDRMRVLEHQLGAILIQFPRSFTRRHEERLRDFLPLLPPDLHFAIEFRSESWNNTRVFDLLREYGVAWCVTHWQDLPPVVATTTDWAYFRLVGYHDEFSYLGEARRDRSNDLATWAETITELAPRLKRIHVYINNHYAGHAPTTISQLKGLLGLPQADPRSLWPQGQGQLPGLAV